MYSNKASSEFIKLRYEFTYLYTGMNITGYIREKGDNYKIHIFNNPNNTRESIYGSIEVDPLIVCEVKKNNQTAKELYDYILQTYPEAFL